MGNPGSRLRASWLRAIALLPCSILSSLSILVVSIGSIERERELLELREQVTTVGEGVADLERQLDAPPR